VATRAPTLVVLGLLVATAVGFAVTQQLKLEPVALSDLRVGRLFSPVCGCATRSTTISFRLRRADRVTVSIRDAAGATAAVLARDRALPRGRATFKWQGRGAPDGAYKVDVRLARAGRTFHLPPTIRIDTRPPVLHVLGTRAAPGSLTVRYRLSERGHVLLLVDGRRALRTYRTRPRGSFNWYGRVGGRDVGAGRHRLALVAVDLAGNRSQPERPLPR
jgi:hypothetical protein